MYSAIVIGDEVVYGYKDLDQLEKLLRSSYPKEFALIEAEAEAAKKAKEEADKQAILLELPTITTTQDTKKK